MIKFSETSHWDFGIEPVSIIRDVKGLTKRGSAEPLLKYARTKGQTDVHIIALGAIEGTGFNRNVDGFHESDCIKNAHWFVDSGVYDKVKKAYDGRAFNRHHKNKPEDPKYGNIKAAAYNHKMKRLEVIVGHDDDKCADILDEIEKKGQANYSMASKQEYDICFTNDAQVEIENRLVSITDCLIGDRARTHSGKVRQVKNIFNRKYSGELYTFDVTGSAFEITTTETHPFYVLSANKVRHGGKNGRGDIKRIDYNKIDFTPEWLPAKDISEGDYLLYPIIRSDESLDLSAHAYALGLYLGDGSLLWSKGKDAPTPLGLSWTFDDKDPEIADKLIEIYPGAKKYLDKERHCIVVNLRNAELAQLAFQHFGVYSESKFISEDILTKANNKTKLGILAGFLDSDGSVDQHRYSSRFTGINKDVLYNTRALLLSINIPCGWQKSPVYDYVTRKLTDKFSYSVSVGAGYCHQVQQSIKIQKYGGVKPKQNKSFIYKNYFVAPILEITSEFVEDLDVYNLQVEEDESYLVNGIAVHNCTWCKHKAASDKDRCDDIPKHLGEINKLGEICGMVNPNPRWFELSHVLRPADRIGMSLKIASSEHVHMLPSDYLKMYTGFTPPVDDTIFISKKASDKRYLINKISEMEKRVEAISQGHPKDSKEKYIKEQASKLKESDHLSDSTIDELRKFEPAKLFRALADNGIILNPDEFTKYTFGDRVSKDRVKGMKTHLPSIFSKLKEDGDEAVNDEHFEPSSMDSLPKEIRSLVGGLVGDHSLFGPYAHNRVIRITIIKKASGGLSPELPDEAKSKVAFDFALAKTYATYKLAALNYLDEQGKLDDELIWNTLLQNR